MFEKLEEKKQKLLEQLEDYYFFVKGWDLDKLLDNLDKLTKGEKRFFNEIKKQIDKIELTIKTELF